MVEQVLSIPLRHPALDETRGLLNEAEGDARGTAVLLAHGAGAPMDSEFMTATAHGLARRGLTTLRFHYPYMERAAREGRRRPPDAKKRLLECHVAALERLTELLPDHRVLFVGKSMGGRMGSLLAAEGAVRCDALAFLGYPLHAPRKPDRLRSEHFAAIAQPALFLQGTRDALGSPDLLREQLDLWGGPVELVEVQDADHDFKVLKRTGRTREEVLSQLADEIDGFERRVFPG